MAEDVDDLTRLLAIFGRRNPALAGRVGQPLRPDQREFAQVRWWTAAKLRPASPDRFEPHLLRALDALGSAADRQLSALDAG